MTPNWQFRGDHVHVCRVNSWVRLVISRCVIWPSVNHRFRSWASIRFSVSCHLHLTLNHSRPYLASNPVLSEPSLVSSQDRRRFDSSFLSSFLEYSSGQPRRSFKFSAWNRCALLVTITFEVEDFVQGFIFAAAALQRTEALRPSKIV